MNFGNFPVRICKYAIYYLYPHFFQVAVGFTNITEITSGVFFTSITLRKIKEKGVFKESTYLKIYPSGSKSAIIHSPSKTHKLFYLVLKAFFFVLLSLMLLPIILISLGFSLNPSKEAVARRSSVKKVFLKISQNSQTVVFLWILQDF